MPSRIFKPAERTEDGGSILDLTFTPQLTRQPSVRGRLVDYPRVGNPSVDRSGKLYGRTRLGSLTAEHRGGLGLCLPYHHRDTRLDDSRLLESNLFGCVAQKSCVVKGNIGDYAKHGSDDVGAVEPSAQSGLDDGHVDPFAGKILKRHRRCQLKETRSQP